MTDQRADADGGRRAGAGSVLNPLAQQNRNASVATSATASTLMSPSRRLFFAGHANSTVIKAELLERLVFKALWLFALCTLFISANLVATARNSHQASFLTYVVKDVLTGDHRIDGLRGFEDIRTYDHYWKWLQVHFVPMVFAKEWYNGSQKQQRDRRVFAGNNFLVGNVRIRQVRVRDNTCKIRMPNVQRVVSDDGSISESCYGSYRKDVGSTAQRDAWLDQYNQNASYACRDFVPPGNTEDPAAQWDEHLFKNLYLNCNRAHERCALGKEIDQACASKLPGVPRIHCTAKKHGDKVLLMNRCLDAFRYRKHTELGTGVSQFGDFTFYEGGGYALELSTQSTENVMNLLMDLKALRWIDYGTRAIFHDFSFYNPALELFSIARLLVEFPGAGGAKGSVLISTVDLNLYNDHWERLVLVLDILYWLLVSRLFCLTMLCFRRKPWQALMNMVWWLDFTTSFVGIAIAINRIISISLAKGNFKVLSSGHFDNEEDHIALHRAAYYLTMDRTLCAIAAMLSWFRLLGLLLFWPRIKNLFSLLMIGLKNIAYFLLIFFIATMAFTHAFYLIYSRLLYTHRTLGSTCFELVAMLLGDLGKYEEMLNEERIVTPVIFSFFLIAMFFILLNAFIALMSDAFSGDAKKRTKFKFEEDYLNGSEEDDLDFHRYVGKARKFARQKLLPISVFADLETVELSKFCPRPRGQSMTGGEAGVGAGMHPQQSPGRVVGLARQFSRQSSMQGKEFYIYGRVGHLKVAQPVDGTWQQEQRIQAVYYERPHYNVRNARRWWDRNKSQFELDEAVAKSIGALLKTFWESGFRSMISEIRSGLRKNLARAMETSQSIKERLKANRSSVVNVDQNGTVDAKDDGEDEDEIDFYMSLGDSPEHGNAMDGGLEPATYNPLAETPPQHRASIPHHTTPQNGL